MIVVTTVTAKLTPQETPDYILQISAENLKDILDGMTSTNEEKLDNPKHWSLVNTLRKLKDMKRHDFE